MTQTFPRFAPGQIVATPGALDLLAQHGVSPDTLLRRHLSGDWGTVSSADAAANEAALKYGSRLLSSYTLAPGVTVWVITEAEDDHGQRRATTLLRPEDY